MAAIWDEMSQFKYDCDRIGAQKRGQSYAPKPWESLPYLAKEETGKIHVRGFLHDDVARNADGTFTHPTKLTTDEIVRRLNRAWREHAKGSRDTKVTHHRLVISFSNEFHDTLVAAGRRNPDMALSGMIERAMHSFQDKFHRGDSVGYSYGLHHDTDNLHAHVFIHPRTRDGAFVGLSEQLQKKAARGAQSRHKDQLKFLRERVRHRAGEILKEISDPTEAAYLRQNMHSDRIFFIPRLSHTERPRNDHRPRTPADNQLEQKRAAVAALDKQIAAKNAARSQAAADQNIGSIFRLRQPKWLRRLQQAQSAKIFVEMRELQAQRHRLWAEYREARRRLNPGPHDTRDRAQAQKSRAASTGTHDEAFFQTHHHRPARQTKSRTPFLTHHEPSQSHPRTYSHPRPASRPDADQLQQRLCPDRLFRFQPHAGHGFFCTGPRRRHRRR